MNCDISDITSGITWVWFDLDDTLIDFRSNSREALRLLYEMEKLSDYYPSAEKWTKTYETHNHSLWDRYGRGEISQDFLRVDRFATPLAPGWKGTPEELEAYSRKLDPLYLDLLARQKGLVDGAIDLLQYLRAHNYKIGVLSNGFTDVQHRKLQNCGLTPLVDIMVLSDDIGVNKPDVRIYRHAMACAGEPVPSRHIMIGDNAATDILGAVGAGWRSIHLNPAARGMEMVEDTLITRDLRLLFSLKW